MIKSLSMRISCVMVVLFFEFAKIESIPMQVVYASSEEMVRGKHLMYEMVIQVHMALDVFGYSGVRSISD